MKLVDFTQVENLFIVCGKTDMRRQIDGLAATVVEEYDMDIYDDALFLFYIPFRFIDRLCHNAHRHTRVKRVFHE